MKQKTLLCEDKSEVAGKQERQREVNVAGRIGIANVSKMIGKGKQNWPRVWTLLTIEACERFRGYCDPSRWLNR